MFFQLGQIELPRLLAANEFEFDVTTVIWLEFMIAALAYYFEHLEYVW